MCVGVCVGVCVLACVGVCVCWCWCVCVGVGVCVGVCVCCCCVLLLCVVVVCCCCFCQRLTTSQLQSSRIPAGHTLSLATLARTLPTPTDAEIDDEHIMNALSQVCHSNEESLLSGAQSILASTENSLHCCHRKENLAKSFDDDQITNLLENQKERLLAEAKSEILKHEFRADLADDNIRELNRQIESQRVEIGSFTDYEQSTQEQDPLHEELAERERALREIRIRTIHEVEELKRARELRVDEFS